MASNSTYTQETSGLDVAKAYSSHVSGKTVLITGVSIGGIGDATARAFAHGGASLILITGRNEEKLIAVTEKLRSDYPKTKFRTFKLDLDSLTAVRQCVKEIQADAAIQQIDILVANAGSNAFTGERVLSVDGIEKHLAANHLAHFLFVTQLLPKLRLAAKGNSPGATRIVVLSSAAMISSPFRFSDYNFEGKPVPEEELGNLGPIKAFFGVQDPGPDGYEANIAYAQSKTANTLFAVYLNTLLAPHGIYAFSVNPGLVTSTGGNAVFDKVSPEQKEMMKTFGIFKTIDQGAATTIVAALDAGLTPEAGVYLDNCQIGEAPAWATSQTNAERLWKLSEELVGETVEV